jgi:hypothetical protein
MVSENQIVEFLSGLGPYRSLEHVRAVEATNYSNAAHVFIRKPSTDEVIDKEIKFKPFVLLKKWISTFISPPAIFHL